MLAAALALAQAQTPLPVQADQSKIDKAGEVAVFGFMGTCAFGVQGAPTPASYANRVKASAPRFLAGIPANQVNMEGVGGKTCRVTYTGPNADRVFAGFKTAANPGQRCSVQAAGPDNVKIVCAPALLMDGYEANITRSLSSDGGRVVGSISVTDRGLGPTGEPLQDIP